jgi:hypothetical protein
MSLAKFSALGFEEGYDVVRTVHLVSNIDQKVYRIEILQPPTGDADARYYEKSEQGTWNEIQNGPSWVSTQGVDQALSSAMSLLNLWIQGKNAKKG